MSWARIDRWIFAGVTALAAVLCTAGLYRAVALLFLRVPLDPDEGWNAYHAAAAMAGRGLYPRGDTFFFNNYPPLSYYVVGTFGSFIGDNIFGGRLVALLALAAVVVAIVLLAREAKCRWTAAAFGGLFFAAVLLLFTDYVGMDDPQLLGHALQLGGFLLIVSPTRSLANIAFAALLFVGGVFVKHNLLVLPAAAFLWLVSTENRRHAFYLGFLGYVFGYSYLVTADVMLKTRLLFEVFSPRVWSFSNLVHGLTQALPWLVLPAAGIVLLVMRERKDRFVRFAAIYASLALVAALASLGGDGVDANAWFDFAIASSLIIALLLERAAALQWEGPAVAVLVAPLGVVLCLSIDADWLAADFWLHPMRDEAAAAEADIAFLKTQKGDAICETLALCYWAGKPPAVDIFNLGEAYATHARNDAALVDAIAKKKFAVVEFENFDEFPLTPGVLSALKRNFELARTSDDGAFFVPKP
jgi:hypothetical protein